MGEVPVTREMAKKRVENLNALAYHYERMIAKPDMEPERRANLQQKLKDLRKQIKANEAIASRPKAKAPSTEKPWEPSKSAAEAAEVMERERQAAQSPAQAEKLRKEYAEIQEEEQRQGVEAGKKKIDRIAGMIKLKGESSAETIRGHQGEPNQPGIQPEGGEDLGGKDIHIAGEREEGAQPKGGEAAPGLKPEEKWPRGEDIHPRKEEFTLEDSLPRDIRINKKDSPETTKTKLEQAKAKVEETLKNYIDDYHDLLDRKDEAVSEYDKSMGYGWEVGANLRQNHISFAKSQLEAINKALGELEPAKAAAITLDHLTKLHDEIPKMDEAAKAETRTRLEDEAKRHEGEGKTLAEHCAELGPGKHTI